MTTCSPVTLDWGSWVGRSRLVERKGRSLTSKEEITGRQKSDSSIFIVVKVPSVLKVKEDTTPSTK